MHHFVRIFFVPSSFSAVSFTSATHNYYPTDDLAKFDLTTRSSEPVRFCVLVEGGSDVKLLFDFGDGHKKIVDAEVDWDFLRVKTM